MRICPDPACRSRLPLRRISVFRHLALACVFLAAVRPATAQKRHRDPEPDVVRNTNGLTEIGTLNAVPYRIDIPVNWNRALVVYFHGYQEAPSSFVINSPLNNQVQPIYDRGYAVIQSAYSTFGWALAEAYPETEELRLYFLKRYGQPVAGRAAAKNMETIVEGGSMGGALVVATLELNPKPYAGGLDLCGSVGPSDLTFQRRFALRAAFDFFFPHLLPPLVPTPPNFEETRAGLMRVENALAGNPASASAMRNLTGLHTDREVADQMIYYTFQIADFQRRAGGNPFDNRNYLYGGSSPTSSATDNALNDGVHRFAADPHAREYLLHHYTPSGRLGKPMLALHTTYDPRVPTAQLISYGEQVAEAGFTDNLVQQFVKRDGHCTFSEEEVGHAFDELINWIHTGHRPLPGALPPLPAPPPKSNTAATTPIH
jgi:pimeloyl-ACP methyl ester carboxylesterase